MRKASTVLVVEARAARNAGVHLWRCESVWWTWNPISRLSPNLIPRAGRPGLLEARPAVTRRLVCASNPLTCFGSPWTVSIPSANLGQPVQCHQEGLEEADQARPCLRR